MNKLLFLIHTLGGGGAEKALVNLANNLDPQKYDITVETMFGDGVNAKSLKPHIHYVSKKAPCPKGISVILKFIPARWLYRFFIGNQEFDLIIAFMHGAPVKVISGAKNSRRIAWLHNGNPKTSTMFSPWFLQKDAFHAYRICKAIVGVCQSVSSAFSEYTSIHNNIHVVYNTIESDAILELAKQHVSIEINHNVTNIVSTGRLGKEKGYLRLLDVCKRLKDEGYRFGLYLIGTGSEENALKEYTRDIHLDEEVIFLGYQENPYRYIDKCDLFVCSSFTEGLSTATIEALILGKAIVSTNVSGAKEILGNNEYGLIVENSTDGIYDGIKKMLDNPKLMNEYCVKAKLHGVHFSKTATVRAAEDLFDRMLSD